MAGETEAQRNAQAGWALSVANSIPCCGHSGVEKEFLLEMASLCFVVVMLGCALLSERPFLDGWVSLEV